MLDCRNGYWSTLLLQKVLSIMKNNIKKFRNELKISQKDLAQSLRVSRQTINAIETGKFDPSLTLTIKITRFFNKSLEEIFIMGEE
tara:strand:- start:747 stop:1004 length:258 start_codon:yes stop_codon:yes gene_type:complete